MADYGRQVIASTGIPIQVLAAGDPIWHPVGVSLDWSTVTAVGSDTVTSPAEGLNVKAGQKYLRYGQVICQVTATSTYTVTETGTPTGGTFGLAGTRPDTGAFIFITGIAQGSTGAQVAALLAAAFTDIPCTGTGSAGGPFTLTTTIQGLQPWAVAFTGGTTPNLTVAAGTTVANTGMWGPHDPSASDGRQTLTRGQCAILNTTVLQNGVLGIFTTMATNHPPALDGGTVFINRVIATGGSASLAAGPTYTNLFTAFPRLSPADMPGLN